MNKVINIFDNKHVNNRFFDQFTHIHFVEIKNNRLYIRLGLIAPTGKKGPLKLVIPPIEWIQKLNCDLWDPDHGYQAKAHIEDCQKNGNYLELKSTKLNPPIGASLNLSDKTLVTLNGGKDQSLLANWAEVNPKKQNFS